MGAMGAATGAGIAFKSTGAGIVSPLACLPGQSLEM